MKIQTNDKVLFYCYDVSTNTYTLRNPEGKDLYYTGEAGRKNLLYDVQRQYPDYTLIQLPSFTRDLGNFEEDPYLDKEKPTLRFITHDEMIFEVDWPQEKQKILDDLSRKVKTHLPVTVTVDTRFKTWVEYTHGIWGIPTPSARVEYTHEVWGISTPIATLVGSIEALDRQKSHNSKIPQKGKPQASPWDRKAKRK